MNFRYKEKWARIQAQWWRAMHRQSGKPKRWAWPVLVLLRILAFPFVLLAALYLTIKHHFGGRY